MTPDILALLRASVGSGGPAPAVSDGEDTLSYTDLRDAVAGLAGTLLAGGVRVGDPVVVHARLGRWAIVGMLAALWCGAQYVPVDTAFPVRRRLAMLRDSGARVAVVDPDGDLPPGMTCAVVRADDRAGAVEPVSADGPAYTMFTSGSTGVPKPVVVSRRALGYSTAARLDHYPDAPGCFLLCSSISFDSSVAGVYWTLAAGGHLVIPSALPGDVLAVEAAARRHRATHLLMIPSLYDLLLDIAEDSALAGLSTVVVAGETCPPALVGRHYRTTPNAVLYNEYGPTECTVWALVHACVPEDADAPDVPIGRPLPGTSTRVVADGGDVPTGRTGELWIQGPGVTSGTVYRTGDLVRVDEAGRTHFVGRRDGQVKVAGLRVELGEVESLLRRLSGAAVAIAAVGPAHLVGFVVRPGADFDAMSVRQELARHLPGGAVPVEIRVLDAAPTLPNGKVDRTAVSRLAAAR